MRVRMEQEAKTTGLFSRNKHVAVKLTVAFSEEEQAIIAQHRLQDHIFLERLEGGHRNGWSREEKEARIVEHSLKIRDVLGDREDCFLLNSPSQAKAYQLSLRQALKELKSYLNENKGLSEVVSFEL